MKITNNYNLPSGFYNAARDDDDHYPVAKNYSVTTLLKPDRQILLERRHYDEIEDDCSNRVWQIFGTAIHKVLEEADTTGFTELSFTKNIIDDYWLTGRVDLYDKENGVVEDYKSAKVYKIIKNDFSDWRLQGLMYAWLIKESCGVYTNKLRFHALLKDWTPMDKKKASYTNSFYPERSIYTWEYNISVQDYIEIEDYIYTRFKSLIASEKLGDDELPECTVAERWNDGNRYAVKKPNVSRAIKLFDDYDEAKKFSDDNHGTVIEERVGEDKRCNYYCASCQFCKHYKEENK